MTMRLESVAKRQAVFASVQSILLFTLFVVSWLIPFPFGITLPEIWLWLFALLVATLLMVYLSPERVANRLAEHLHPHPPRDDFKNLVDEIAIALAEPVECIQTYDCPVPNIIMLPCSDRDIVVATTGALEHLKRDELQALVAAQFAGMRDPWCRLATRAELMWWFLPWFYPLFFLALITERTFAAVFCFFAIPVWVFLPRRIEQARDLCADVVAVRKTLHPEALGSAMRKLAEHSELVQDIKFGPWYLPTNPFIVVPKRRQRTITMGREGETRQWNTSDEVRMELLLRADRADAMANGQSPEKFTGKEFVERWSRLGR